MPHGLVQLPAWSAARTAEELSPPLPPLALPALPAVWAAAHATPLMVGKRFFRSQVTDLAWTPDGYTLLASSSDGGRGGGSAGCSLRVAQLAYRLRRAVSGKLWHPLSRALPTATLPHPAPCPAGTLACFQFAASELGQPHSQEELDAAFQQLYGSARAAAGGGKRLFAESAEQLHLEAAAQAAAAAPAPLPQAVQQQQAAVERALQPSAKQNMDALSARLSGRMGGGAEVQLGFDAPVVGEGAPGAAAGRKRLAPEPIGGGPPARPASAELMPPPPPRPSGGGQEAGKRVRLEPTPVAAGGARAAAQPAAAGAASGRAAGAGTAAAGGGGAAAVAALPHIMLRGPEVPAEVTADLGCPPRLFEDPSAPPAEEHRRTLRVTNREAHGSAAGGSRRQADVACLEGRGVSPVWSDTLRGAAVAACGTHNFAAVGLEDGQLLVRAGGGGALPGICSRVGHTA